MRTLSKTANMSLFGLLQFFFQILSDILFKFTYINLWIQKKRTAARKTTTYYTYIYTLGAAAFFIFQFNILIIKIACARGQTQKKNCSICALGLMEFYLCVTFMPEF